MKERHVTKPFTPHSRWVTHALHPTCDHDRALSGLKTLSSQHDGLHPTCTDLVDGRGFSWGRASSAKSDLASRTLAYVSLEDVTHVDLLNIRGFDACTSNGPLHDLRTEIGGRESLEDTWHRTDGSPASSDDEHLGLLGWRVRVKAIGGGEGSDHVDEKKWR